MHYNSLLLFQYLKRVYKNKSKVWLLPYYRIKETTPRLVFKKRQNYFVFNLDFSTNFKSMSCNTLIKNYLDKQICYFFYRILKYVCKLM